MSTKVKKKTGVVLVIVAVILLAVAAGVYFLLPVMQGQEPEPEVLTATTLEEIIQVSELSTFTAVYNGVAEVMPIEEKKLYRPRCQQRKKPDFGAMWYPWRMKFFPKQRTALSR